MPIDTELIMGIVQSLFFRDKSTMSTIMLSTCPVAMNIITVDCHCWISLKLSFPVQFQALGSTGPKNAIIYMFLTPWSCNRIEIDNWWKCWHGWSDWYGDLEMIIIFDAEPIQHWILKQCKHAGEIYVFKMAWIEVNFWYFCK